MAGVNNYTGTWWMEGPTRLRQLIAGVNNYLVDGGPNTPERADGRA